MYLSSIPLLLSIIPYFITVSGAPAVDRQTSRQNGEKAQKLNAQFASIKKTDPCQSSEIACIEGMFGQCVNGVWQTTSCNGDTQCFALPLVNSAGTSVTCDTRADALARFSATGVSGGLTGSGSAFMAVSSHSNHSDESAQCSEEVGANSTAHSGVTNEADRHGDATVTETVTVTASSPPTAVATGSATLAPGFSLSPSSGDAAPTASVLNNSEASVFSSIATTITLTPASASAFLSSLSATPAAVEQSTAPSVPSVSEAATPTATGVAGDSNAVSLSLFTTTPASPTPDGSQTPAAAAAAAVTPSAGYGSGY